MNNLTTILQKHHIHSWAELDHALDRPNAYSDLFEYCMNSGDMPYGVMKARTGDPWVWMSDYIGPTLDKVGEEI